MVLNILIKGNNMANMSYCRFENTYRELCICADHTHDEDLSDSESKYRWKLIELCGQIVEEQALIDDGDQEPV